MNSSFYKYFFSLTLISILNISVVFGHDILKTLSKDQIAQVQQNLISKGYLKSSQIKFGIYDENTEKAFDEWQNDKEKETLNIETDEKTDFSNKKNNVGTTTEGITDTTQDKSFWSKLWDYLISWFK